MTSRLLQVIPDGEQTQYTLEFLSPYVKTCEVTCSLEQSNWYCESTHQPKQASQSATSSGATCLSSTPSAGYEMGDPVQWRPLYEGVDRAQQADGADIINKQSVVYREMMAALCSVHVGMLT
ncbi:hypothetical protein ABBQ32_004587 [Trebouxia sp. C0010 RCD-2024]